jgi:protocatechuate 3,4-dioxygenase beta subunit
MNKHIILAALLIIPFSACLQHKKPQGDIKAGGLCEGCEAIYESPVSFAQLNETDTLPDFEEEGIKLNISGTVYKSDGKTPAPDVIIYLYHTDQKGVYAAKEKSTGWAKRHGYIRGWLKTNAKGEYNFFTLRPASYPGSTIPAHIHPTIKEQGITEYYIDDFLFDDDPFLTEAERRKLPERGGNGILKLKKSGDIYFGERNIILGKNIPEYPK